MAPETLSRGLFYFEQETVPLIIHEGQALCLAARPVTPPWMNWISYSEL